MNLPKIFNQAVLQGNKVLFPSGTTDEELVEYLVWKSALRINTLTVARLRTIHRKGLHSKEIFQVFKNNKKIKYLSQEVKKRSF